MERLPLDLAWPEIEGALKSHRNLVLVAEPGAGKTTRFPPALLRSGLIDSKKKILMLEPRRLAARASAHRIAFEQRWQLGSEVGYQVRFENRTSASTRLHVLTEGLLARRLQSDPELSDVGAVILDEFHERSQHTDLALGLLFELQELSRQDLRIIVMSATLDAEKVARYLNDCPVVKVPGRTFPVTVHHGRRPLALDTGPAFLDSVADIVRGAISGSLEREGDVLVFLPGAREIRGVGTRIAGDCERAGFVACELHGSLSLDDQDRAIRRDPSRKKIVLATNIAETSLTIDGVGTVIDSGLARVVRVDAAGFERLQISRISLASAKQRAGRAGRQGPGHCHRLWSKFDEASLPEFEQPELLRTDLTDAIFALLSQGVTDPEGFSWFERPPLEAIRFAASALIDLGFRDPRSGALTGEGREALKVPLPAHLSRLMLEAIKFGAIKLGARLSALLSEKDILSSRIGPHSSHVESDVLLRLGHLEDGRGSAAADPHAARNVLRVAEAIENSASRIRVSGKRAGVDDPDELALRLLTLAFPDRVCRRRRAKQPAARMVGGRGVTLAPFSTLETAELFVAIASYEPPPHLPREARVDAQISVASRIERAWLKEYFPEHVTKKSEIVFNEETLDVQRRHAESFHDLPLEEPHVSRAGADEAFPILVREARARWESIVASHVDLQRVLARLRFIRASFANESVAELDTADVENRALEEACFGETRLAAVVAKPLDEIYLRSLPQGLARLLNEAAPDSLTVPSGSHIRVQYPEARPPFLEVRIQEIFGMKSSPKVGGGRVPLVFHLLGPNYRPVQVTSDLESFWKTGYSEVRKELRSRYPKHSWPDDPTTATPEAKGRRRS